MKKTENIIGGVGLLFVLISLIWYSVTNIWEVYHWVLLILGIAGIVYFAFNYYKGREKELSTRSIKQGSNVLIQITIVFAITAMAAFILNKQNARWDLTSGNLYSLSDQTEKILTTLDKDVEIKAFYKSAEQNRAKDLLDEYSHRTSSLDYELIDPDEEPQVASQYGVSKYNTITVESGIKRESIEQLSETNLTNAIIKVTREQDKVIYFLTGHGERSIKDDQQTGYKQAAEAIGQENHLVRELYLAQRGSIPDSCSVLAIVSPQNNLFPAELDTIEKFINDGGKVLMMLDPDRGSNLREFVGKFHINVAADMVIERSFAAQLFGAGPGIPLVNIYDENHVITKDFQGMMTFFPYTSSVMPMEDKGGFTITELLKTSENSWADEDFTSGTVSFDEGQDRQGPITIGVLAEKGSGENKSTLVVLGDSDFASNGYLGQQANKNLFLNTINYLAEEEDLISIRPKQVDDRRLTLTQADVSGLFYLVVIAIPLIVVVLGVVVFFKRNRA